MRALSWILFIAVVVAAIYTFRLWRQRWEQRRKASEERMASFIAQVAPLPAKEDATPQPRIEPAERLLLDAAAKAGDAGEPALAIQLYARLLARYPQSTLGAQARAGVDEQKRKLAKG